MDVDSYEIFKVLSPPRKVLFCEQILHGVGVDETKTKILRSTVVPRGPVWQRILAVEDRYGNFIEIISTNNQIHLQSNSKKAINSAVRNLFLSGEILIKIQPNQKNHQVYKHRIVYEILNNPGEYYPISWN